MGIVIWKKKRICLGDQDVTEWTLLEWKKLFSLKLFHFHKTSGIQDRFHTHAFKAVSLLLKGNYVEEVVMDGVIHKRNRNTHRLLYIPANQYHRITRSDGCYTLLLTGPWGETFSELRHIGDDQYQEVTCGKHRVDVSMGHIIELKEST